MSVIDRYLPKHRDLPTRPAGKELLVREPDEGRVHFLNASATVVWECCDGKTTFGECAERMRIAFPIPPEVNLDSDIEAAIADLSEKGLLDKDPAIV